MQNEAPISLITIIRDIEDPREERTRLHTLEDILVIGLCAALDPKKFLEVFMRWTPSLRQAVAEEIVAIDGKALRRALDAGESPKVIVSAWAASNGLVLGQQKVSDKSNEPTAGR